MQVKLQKNKDNLVITKDDNSKVLVTNQQQIKEIKEDLTQQELIPLENGQKLHIIIDETYIDTLK